MKFNTWLWREQKVVFRQKLPQVYHSTRPSQAFAKQDTTELS